MFFDTPLEAFYTLLFTSGISAFFYVVWSKIEANRCRISGFDGPPGLPVLGNIHQLGPHAPETYRQWADKYGSVFQIQLGIKPVLVVNSADAAKTLFISNSLASNSRPEFYTFHRVVSSTAGYTIGTSPFCQSLKRRRKCAASALNRPSVKLYLPHIASETKDFICAAIEIGGAGNDLIDPMPLVQRLSLNLSLILNWGTRIRSFSDPLFEEIVEVEDFLSRCRSTTGNLQDYIPILRWIPFANHLGKAKAMRNRRDVYLRRLNRQLRGRIDDGTYSPCIQASVMLNKTASKLSEDELTSISLTLLSGGLDTVTTLLHWTIAELASRPDVQEEAYKELLKVHGQLPEEMCLTHYLLRIGEQKPAAPYVQALVKECLRYFSVLRLALPRRTTRDITYNGDKLIPAGTVLFLNVWACNNDYNLWPDAHKFRPERFIEKPDAPLFSFGQGSRMCTGALLANSELYMLISTIILFFRIVKNNFGTSHVVDPLRDVAESSTLVSQFHPYKVKFVPRDQELVARILQERLA